MIFDRIQAAEVKLWDFSAYLWNTPRICYIPNIVPWWADQLLPQLLWKTDCELAMNGLCHLLFMVHKSVMAFHMVYSYEWNNENYILYLQ